MNRTHNQVSVLGLGGGSRAWGVGGLMPRDQGQRQQGGWTRGVQETGWSLAGQSGLALVRLDVVMKKHWCKISNFYVEGFQLFNIFMVVFEHVSHIDSRRYSYYHNPSRQSSSQSLVLLCLNSDGVWGITKPVFMCKCQSSSLQTFLAFSREHSNDAPVE